jgi:hypothetical protein
MHVAAAIAFPLPGREVVRRQLSLLNQALLLLIDVVVLVIQNRVVANDPLGRLLCALTLNVSCPCACAAEQDGNQGAFDAPCLQWQFTLL